MLGPPISLERYIPDRHSRPIPPNDKIRYIPKPFLKRQTGGVLLSVEEIKEKKEKEKKKKEEKRETVADIGTDTVCC